MIEIASEMSYNIPLLVIIVAVIGGVFMFKNENNSDGMLVGYIAIAFVIIVGIIVFHSGAYPEHPMYK